MQDPLIRQLFPQQTSIKIDIPLSSGNITSVKYADIPKPFSGDVEQDEADVSTMSNYLSGSFDLSGMVMHASRSYFPFPAVRSTFLHLQGLSSITYGPNYYTHRDGVASYILGQAFYGKGMLRYEGQEYELLPGDVFLLDCRLLHEYAAASSEGWGYRFAHFDGPAMAGYFALLRARKTFKFTPEDDAFEKLFGELFTVGFSSQPLREIQTNRILTDMITYLLCRLPSDAVFMPPAISGLCDYLQSTCCEKLTLDEIAAGANLSKYYISRTFKQYTGKTIFQYILDCRINIAQRLLCCSDLPVSEIALSVGFEDPNNFYRAFEKREKMSPSRYRKAMAMVAGAPTEDALRPLL